MIDTADLLARVDLVRLVGAQVDLRRVGQELHGECPFCPCTSRERRHRCDRFRIGGRRTHWFCRRCRPDGGDAITFLMQRDNLTFNEACAALGTGLPIRHARPLQRARPVERRDEVQAPSVAWQARAEVFVSQAEQALWTTGRAERARAWLHQRGLRDDTLKRWRIGFCSTEGKGNQAEWGLDRDPWLPLGISIPWVTLDGAVYAIKIRRPVAAGTKGKYIAIEGSVMGILFGQQTVRPHLPGFLFESELDVVLAAQEAGDLAMTGTLNGTNTNLTLAQIWSLRQVHPIYVALDNDDAGYRAAQKLIDLGNRFRPVRWPDEVKDLADLAPAGYSVRLWVERHLTLAPAPTAVVAPMSMSSGSRCT